jgi:hypothetical protein
MLKLLIIWFIFSIILTLFYSRLIKRSSKTNLGKHESFENIYWFTEDTDVRKTYWYINECPPCGKLHLDYKSGNEVIMKIVLN